MADPTVAEIETQLKNHVRIFEEIEQFAATNSPNLIGLQDDAAQDLEGEYIPSRVPAAVASLRANVNACLTPAAIRSVLDPIILEYGRVIGVPETDPLRIIGRIYDYWVTNSKTLNGRGCSAGSPSAAGGNTGSGAIYRLALDHEGEQIEAVHGTDSYTAECVKDYGQDGEHQETFEVRSLEAEPDHIKVGGAGIKTYLQCLSESQVSNYLENPSFSTYSGTAAGGDLAFNGWTLSDGGDGTDFEENTTSTYIYHGEPDVSTPVSIRFIADGNFYQQPVEKGKTGSAGVPWFLGCAIYRRDSCDGTLTISTGSKSRAITMSGLGNAAFTFVICPSTLGANNWYDNFRENDLDLRWTLASRTTGSCYISNIKWAPMTRIGGTYYVAIPGATAFLREDSFTWSDTENGSRGKLQYWLWRGGYGYLPSLDDGNETVTDPS